VQGLHIGAGFGGGRSAGPHVAGASPLARELLERGPGVQMHTMIAVVGLMYMAVPAVVEASAPQPGPAMVTPPRRGLGMLVTGGVLTTAGSALLATAAWSFAVTDCSGGSDTGACWAGLVGAIAMPVGVVALAVGAPLLGAGVQRKRVWRAWQRERGVVLRPRLGRSHGAWTVGFTLRF